MGASKEINMFRFLLVFALALATVPTHAQEARFGVRGETLRVTPLTTFRAETGETEHDFVRRVGTFLDRYTAANGFEACAALAMNSGQLIARVSTVESHIGCVVVSSTGDQSINRGIHSHPRSGHVRLNLADNTFLRGDQGRQGPSRANSMRTTGGVSATDRLSGEGYLVEGGQVVFFAPGVPDQVVGPIAASPLPPSMLANQATGASAMAVVDPGK
jgi:hypothetical protein